MKPVTLKKHLESGDTPRVIRGVIETFAEVGQKIYCEINRAGVVGLLGEAGRINVQGEDVKKLDVWSNDVIVAAFRERPLVGALISEEMDDVCRVDGPAEINRYLLTIDPLDGSSNIDVNVTIGSIFALYDVGENAGLLHRGDKIICAGYVLYGPTLNFVFWHTGAAVQGFTVDPASAEFLHTNVDMRIPEKSVIFSVNDANYKTWSPATKCAVDYLRDGREKSTARYVGSLVADFHRNLLKGGVYLYPADSFAPEGKIRLLYEAAPLAKIVVAAGGRATTGKEDILDILPTKVHQRCPTILGSPKVVDEIEKFYRV